MGMVGKEGRKEMADKSQMWIYGNFSSWKDILSVSLDYTQNFPKHIWFLKQFIILTQVGHLEEAYQEWVHQPIVSKEGPRFFESDFWEVKLSNESLY